MTLGQDTVADKSVHFESDDSSSLKTEEGSDPVVVSSLESPRHQDDEDDSKSEVFLDASSCCESSTVGALRTPPPLWSVAGRGKASPLVLKSWIKLALTLDGRDKITKVLQYSARLLAWWFAGKYKNQSQRFTSFYKSMSSSRKAFRLGRSINELDKLRSGDVVSFVERVKSETLPPSDSQPNVGAKVEPAEETENKQQIDVWSTFYSTVKVAGLLVFWAGDNINFLCGNGALDNYSVPKDQRLARRRRLQETASIWANQAYFFGSMAGLVLSLRAYKKYVSNIMIPATERLSGELNLDTSEDCVADSSAFSVIQEKQLSLLLTLVKSVCDVIVFSNNPGIDLHKRLRGKKNNETVHCVCGLISAGTVLYKTFPNK